VRPDGHVGFRGKARDAARLAAWLERSLGLVPGAGGTGTYIPENGSSGSLTIEQSII
jgi:hypothetical protein